MQSARTSVGSIFGSEKVFAKKSGPAQFFCTEKDTFFYLLILEFYNNMDYLGGFMCYLGVILKKEKG